MLLRRRSQDGGGVGRGAQGASRVAPGKLGFNGRGEGNASLLSSHESVAILEPKKTKSVTASTFPPSIYHEVMGLDAMILVF